jgi:hypothetical protein
MFRKFPAPEIFFRQNRTIIKAIWSSVHSKVAPKMVDAHDNDITMLVSPVPTEDSNLHHKPPSYADWNRQIRKIREYADIHNGAISVELFVEAHQCVQPLDDIHHGSCDDLCG